MFTDRNFINGFKVSNTSSVPGPTYLGEIHYGDAQDTKAQWNLCQWTSDYLIYPDDTPSYDGTWYEYATQSKKLRVNTDKGAIYMELNASEEYSAPRVSMQEWPHLLIEQYTEERCPDFSEITELRLKMEFVINKMDCKMDQGEINKTLHTAQFQINFTLHNKNEESPGYNDCIWFGMQFYDWRYSFSDDTIMIDGGKDSGTGLAIYSVSNKRFLDEPVWVGDTVYIDFDILPEIKRAYDAVRNYQEKAVFQNTEFKDLKLTTMNLGWELPGTFDVACTINQLDLIYPKSQ